MKRTLLFCVAVGALAFFAMAINEPTCTGPSISQQPVSQTRCHGQGQSVSFTVTASNAQSYQWRKNGNDLGNGGRISGATSVTLTISSVVTDDAGSYTVAVDNSCSRAISSAATLTVNAVPSIAQQPVSQTNCQGSTVNFSVTASGNSLFYQWRKGANNLSNDGHFSGVTSATLNISNLTTNDASSYSVLVTNSCGSATSSAATLTVNVPPSITQQPTSRTNCQGSATSFTVGASGTAPLSYQWRKGATNLTNDGHFSGVTLATLNISNLTTNDAGSYSVLVTNSCGSATSSDASLTVNVPPSITQQPTNQTVNMGGSVIFAVGASGTALIYQWQHSATNLPGATNASLTLTNVQPAHAGVYSVIVTNLCNAVTSSNAILTVNGSQPPTITTQPTNQTVIQGSNATFSVVATGTSPLSYQWRKNGSNLSNGGRVSGANSNTLTLVNVNPWDAGIYTVVVTNTAGSVISSYAVLRILAPASVVAWGYNSYGQTDVPSGLTNAVAIAGGVVHGLALKSDGTVVAWGTNLYGEASVPSGLTNVAAVAGGMYHSLALKGDGTVVDWGDNSYGETNVPSGLTNVVAIAGGGLHSLALKGDGTVVAWGYNNDGQTNVPSGLTNVVAVAGGGYHSLALKSDGTVVAWGYNNWGQTNVSSGLTNVVAIAGGLYHSLAIKGDGTVVVWGNNDWYQTNVPSGLTNVVAIAGGFYHCLALKGNGTVVAWGEDWAGQTDVPSGLTNVVAIAGGAYHSLALGDLSPVITAQPKNATATYGQSAMFSVQASGTAPLQYQWKRNGTNIPGATSSWLPVSQPAVADSGSAYSVIVSNNYGIALSSTGILTVVKAPLTVMADNKAKLYSTANPALTWSALGFVYGEDTSILAGAPSLSTTATNTSNAGSYTIAITSNTLSAINYSLIFQNGVLTVVKAPLAVMADNKVRTYGAANPALTWTVSGFVNGESTNVLSGTPQLSTPATSTSSVGAYPVIVTAGSLNATNYSFVPVNGTLTVTQAMLTVSANSASRVYGSANPVFTASYNGFVNGETTGVLSGAPSFGTTAVTNSPHGSYPITITAGTLYAANYGFNFINGQLNITPASLDVTADNKTKYVGETNPPLTCTFSGFVAGDGTNVVSGAPVLSTVSSTNQAGTYVITNQIGSLNNANYNFVLHNGWLTNLPPSSEITFSNTVMSYLIGAPPMIIDGGMTVRARGTSGFSNAMLTASFAYGESGDHLSILNLGTGSGQVGVTNTTRLSVNPCR